MDIEVNKIKLHYEILGEGKPIIMLNPNSVYTGLMKNIGNLFQKDYKVYLVDRRGCGKSERNCKLSYEESAKDIYEFIKKLKLDKPYVIGLSGGASVALHLAITFPESISKIVLCSGSARKVTIKNEKWIRKLPWYPGKKNTDKFWKLIDESKEINKEELSKIETDVLVVNGGKRDIIPKEEAKYLAENIKNAKLLIYDKEGHCTYCKKKKWAEDVKKFLINLNLFIKK